VTEPANRPSHGISRTSIFVAAGRAVGAGEPDPSVRNPDYLAGTFLGDPSTLDLDHPAVRALGLSDDDAMKDAEIASNVRMMTIRTRFIDDALERAIAGGARQVVILGAVFDSHACRCGELLAPVRVFEVDQRQMAYPLAEAVVAPRVDIPLRPFSRDRTSGADFADEIRQG
jgi:methyltransferase (TIGR00027 family)